MIDIRWKQKKGSLALVNNWLIALLHESGWHALAARAKRTCKKLGIEHDEPPCCQGIVVWLLDEQFGKDPHALGACAVACFMGGRPTTLAGGLP